MKTNEQIYTEVTDRLVRALEAGTVPWQRPWALAGRPRSLSTRKPYRGVNVLLLGITAAERGYASPFWGTSRQINALGGHIRKGQSKANDAGGTEVLLWKSAVKHEDDAENPGQKVDRKILLARTFYVFNADQCEGLPARFYPQAGAPVEDLADPQAVLDGYLAQPGRDSRPAGHQLPDRRRAVQHRLPRGGAQHRPPEPPEPRGHRAVGRVRQRPLQPRRAGR
jgi:antirestriction protein ArdC